MPSESTSSPGARPTGAGLRPALLLVLGLTAGLHGCLSSNPPVTLRFFAPALDEIEPIERPGLVVDRVVAAPYLDQRMVWRLSDVELAYDELHRWVASPADLVDAAIQRAIHGATTGTDRLRIEVVAFEGLAETDEAHVELLCTRSPGRDRPALLERFSAREPLAGERPDDLARALGKALSTTIRSAMRWEPSATD